MSRKPLSLRSTVVLTLASALGVAAGDLAVTVTTGLGHPAGGAGRLAGALVALWAAGKLESLIEDRE
ncbi:hypothetical protein [Dactylosporangium sp. NPDC006015]|uniref:hypothetical protein n=1 Tax=Dactylosporangium sp. NPDC006015 TaxID=3154576 RepID=UPI0033B322F9